jgi:hypothetical protein
MVRAVLVHPDARFFDAGAIGNAKDLNFFHGVIMPNFACMGDGRQ